MRYKNLTKLCTDNFLERISIPRGKRDGQDYFDYETAVREFIEETGCFFESANVFHEPFVLQWHDDGVVYKYAIYVAILQGVLKNVLRQPNTFCVKLEHTAQTDTYKVNIESRRFNNEISRYLYIVPLNDYIAYMNEKQLITYEYSNYLEFFTFVKKVKTAFDDGRLNEFFLITLKLDLFESYHKWNTKRPKIVMATRRELLNIVNV
nr:putative 25.3 kDa protein [Ectropis obliqua nucleopolyhedrovirus]